MESNHIAHASKPGLKVLVVLALVVAALCALCATAFADDTYIAEQQVVDSDGNPVSGATFSLSKWNDATSQWDIVYQNVSTGSAGTITSNGLTAGSYRWTQTGVPSGYDAPDPNYCDFDIVSASVKVTMTDIKWRTATFDLSDVDAGYGIKGCSVTLQSYDSTAKTWSDVATGTTDSDGQYSVSGLRPGTYHWVMSGGQKINPTGADYYYSIPDWITRADFTIDGSKDVIDSETLQSRVDISLQIDWSDSTKDEYRPDSVYITVVADGAQQTSMNVTLDTAKATQGDVQNYTWEAVPYFATGTATPLTYQCEEHSAGLFDEYTVVYAAPDLQHLTITNICPAHIKINLNKLTRDYYDIPTLDRLSSIQVQIYRDGVAYNPDGSTDPVTIDLTEGAGTSQVEIPYEECKGHSFAFQEILPDGMSAKYRTGKTVTYDDDGNPNMLSLANVYLSNSLTISNVVEGDTPPNPHAFSYTVTFSDGRTYSGINDKGEDVSIASGDTISLADGEWVSLEKLPNGVSYTVTQQDYSSEGYATEPTSLERTGTIVYTQGSEASFTNVYTAASTSYAPQVSKTVTGPEAPGETFGFTLAAITEDAPMPDAGGEDASVALTGVGTGAASFGAITYDEPGVYEYRIEETPGQTAGFAYDDQPVTMTVTTTRAGATLNAAVTFTKNGQTVTAAEFGNVFTATAPVTGTITWEGVEASDKLPAPTVHLYRDGVEIDSKTLAAGATSFDFGSLPKYDAEGNAYEYTTSIDAIDGYDENTEAIDNAHVLTYNPSHFAFYGTKTWVGVPSGVSVPDITIDLLCNGSKIDSTVLKSGHNHYGFSSDMPDYATDGTKCTYTVAEEPVENYTATIDGYSITNTYTGQETPGGGGSADGDQPAGTTKVKTAATTASTGDDVPIAPVALVGLMAAGAVAVAVRRRSESRR